MEFVENITPRKIKLLEQLTPRPPDDEKPQPGILEANHPLLVKFQSSLKAHLLRVQAQLTDELESLDHTIKLKDQEREEIGAGLYDLQQQVQHQRKTIDEYNNNLISMSDKRLIHEANIVNLKKDYEEENINFKKKKQSYNESLVELDNLQVLENNISRWAQEIEDEVALAKRVVSKDAKDHAEKAQEKRITELFLFNLESEVRKRERELQTINDQNKEQDEVIKILTQSLTDANTDLEALQQEHRRLMVAWEQVIVAIGQRDKVLANINNELHEEKQNHKVLDSNIDGTKKSALKEMIQNEKLEGFRARLTTDISSLGKELEKESRKFETYLQNIDKFNMILEQTESDLKKSCQEGIFLQTELSNTRTQLEKQAHKKIQLEEIILELLQDQITTDKASQFRAKLLRETQEKRRNMEISMSNTENQLSEILLDLERWKSITIKLKQDVSKITTEKDEIDGLVNKILDEISTTKTAILLKLRSTDILNRQLGQLIHSAGGKEMNPDEIKEIALEKNIAEIDVKIKEIQNFWMRLQGHIVFMTERRANQLNEIHISRKQLLVIEQKTLQIDNELEQLYQEEREAIRNFGKINTQMDILSSKLCKKKKTHEQEEVQCELTHLELTEKLKTEEMSILNMKQNIKNFEMQIKESKAEVVDKHREALSWESKFKMAVQTKKFRDDEISQSSEIGCMKSEIHRMEVRYAQLKRAQEKLVQDLDNSIQHREHIFDSATCREKISGNKSKTRSNFQQRLNEMKNKYRQLNIEILQMERNITEITVEFEQVQMDVEQKQREIDEEKLQDTLIQSEIEQGILLKQENLENIVRKQRRVKRYNVLAGSKATPKCRSEAILNQDMQRQREVHEHLTSIIEGLITDFPNHKFPISRILQTLKED